MKIWCLKHKLKVIDVILDFFIANFPEMNPFVYVNGQENVQLDWNSNQGPSEYHFTAVLTDLLDCLPISVLVKQFFFVLLASLKDR